MIRYLSQEEKEKTRPLYEEAFPEDGKEFTDFYFDAKMQDNLVIADEEDGQIITMANLNPYMVSLKGKELPADYIVAVATEKAFRRQGRMAGLLERLLRDMKEDQRPFTFLEPADPAYYLPFDFAYVSDHIKRVIREDAGMISEVYGNTRLDEVVSYTNQWLSAHAELYCLRDQEYFRRLVGELEAGGGHLEVLVNEKNEVTGTRAYDYADTKEEDCRLIAADALTKTVGFPEPFMMARIVDLAEFIPAVCLKESSEKRSEDFMIRVTDRIIPENQGTFLWHLNRGTSYLEKLEREETADAPEFNIRELTEWLFGYKTCSRANWCGEIRTLNGVYFDEEI